MRKIIFIFSVFFLLFVLSLVIPRIVLAQSASNQVITKVGNPSGPPPILPGPQYAIQLVNQIRQFCGGSVSVNNINCLNTFIPPINLSAAQQIKDNMAYDGILQCVGFVEAVVAVTTGQPLPIYDAQDYAIVLIPGYSFIKVGQGSIQPGDMPVFAEGSVGHIAYVTNVESDGSFTVAEANYCHPDCGTVNDSRVLPSNYPFLRGWLRKQ